MKTVYRVKGMKCSGCENNIKRILGAIDGIQTVETNLQNSSVTIESDQMIDLDILNDHLGETYMLSK